jgi:SnoaL-like domain
MDKETVTQWLERYVAAWRTYDPQAIGDLFTQDATYRFQPWTDPVTGRDAIVANWLEDPDEPDSWSDQYEPYAVDGYRAVAVGWTSYFAEDRQTIDRVFYNAWLLVFTPDGRCKDFTEVYMEAPVEHSNNGKPQ